MGNFEGEKTFSMPQSPEEENKKIEEINKKRDAWMEKVREIKKEIDENLQKLSKKP